MTSLTIEKGSPEPRRRDRSPWTAEADAHLRKFWGEGKNDRDIGYILDMNRRRVARRRNQLGLPPIPQVRATGWSHTPENRAKFSEENRRRCQDPEYRAKLVQNLRKALAAKAAKEFRQPDRGSPAFKAYRKIRDALGPQVAREQLATIRLTTGTYGD
jgi:hypothetical protein